MKAKRALALLLAAALAGASWAAPAGKAVGTFDLSAIYADGSSLYVGPQEPTASDSVVVKLRVAKDNVDAAILRYDDEAVAMARLASADGFDYYFAEIPPRSATTAYYYEIRQGSQVAYYSRRGLEQRAPDMSYRFKVIPGFEVPGWMKGAVLYQIYVDRFANGDPSNDVLTNEYMYDNWPSVRVEDWNALPDATTPYAEGGNRTREFFGGDLEGVIGKLGYLKGLGIDGIYLNPIFVSPSNHKYDAQDYEHVDPHFGVIVNDGGDLIDPALDPNYAKAGASDASLVNRGATRYVLRTTDPENLAASDAKLAELVEKAHALGIRVILDGVFNHVGSFSRWLDREGIYPEALGPGAYESADSPFRDYFSFARDAWPGNESYETWSGFKTLPKLNYEGSKELESKILGLGARWVGPGFGADGWRLDVAADLGKSPKYNHLFWRMFRDSVKSANPEAVILAEVYGDSSTWLSGGEWDTIMNYDAFFEPVSWFLTGMEKHSYNYRPSVHNNAKAFAADLRDKMAKMPYNSLEAAMNELGNHDHSRFLTRTSGFVDDKRPTLDVSPQEMASANVNKGILKEATIIQMCMPGAPTIYYGDEAGLAGFTDPDDRRTYPWGREDGELVEFFKAAIAVRKELSCLRTGSYAPLSTGTLGTFAFGRWDRAGRAVIAVNNRRDARKMSVPVEALGMSDGEVLTLELVSDREGHSRPKTAVAVAGRAVEIELPPFGGAVLASRSGSREPAPEVAARPRVAAAFPKPGSAAVAGSKAAEIAVEFSEPMRQRDIAAAFSLSPPARGTFVWNGNRATFLPAEPLKPGSYTARIAPSARSIRGDFGMAAPFEWSFSVR